MQGGKLTIGLLILVALVMANTHTTHLLECVIQRMDSLQAYEALGKRGSLERPDVEEVTTPPIPTPPKRPRCDESVPGQNATFQICEHPSPVLLIFDKEKTVVARFAGDTYVDLSNWLKRCYDGRCPKTASESATCPLFTRGVFGVPVYICLTFDSRMKHFSIDGFHLTGPDSLLLLHILR